MEYTLEFERESVANLKALSPEIRQRIVTKINWLVANFDSVKLLPLSADLAGFYKLRVGDYRVIYTVDRNRKVLMIEKVGHRRDIYD